MNEKVIIKRHVGPIQHVLVYSSPGGQQLNVMPDSPTGGWLKVEMHTSHGTHTLTFRPEDLERWADAVLEMCHDRMRAAGDSGEVS